MTVIVECPSCQGLGRIADAECSRCVGTGTVEACNWCGLRPADPFWHGTCSAQCNTARERVVLGVNENEGLSDLSRE
jgi:RecJ-like exonuclease